MSTYTSASRLYPHAAYSSWCALVGFGELGLSLFFTFTEKFFLAFVLGAFGVIPFSTQETPTIARQPHTSRTG
ncbi:MAG: hypothetical protein ACYDHZ_00355 [Dehalococcoidia bacterium]